MVLDQIAEDFSIALVKQKFDTVFGRGSVDGVEVVLAKPMAFMNRSGPQVQQIAGYYRILSEDMLVVHDDIDLAFGRIKIKEKGGDGGHRSVLLIMFWADLSRTKIKFWIRLSPQPGMPL
jgi:PTH1 family peptidyl-tRNA hydrolase